MIHRSLSMRTGIASRTALGIALALGVVAHGAVSAPAYAQKKPAAPKIQYSPAFAKAAAEIDKALGEAVKNPAVQAAMQQARDAKDPGAKAAAVAQIDAAIGGKAKLDGAVAAASTPGDRLKSGEMMRTYGVLVNDVDLQHSGLVMMLDSALLGPANVGQVQWLAGVTAYQKKDYATAARYTQMAKDSGHADPQLDALLADSYKRSNNPAAALASAQKSLDAARAAGTKPSETAIRTALQAAFDAKQAAPSLDLAQMLVRNYPSANAWSNAVGVTRTFNQYQSQDMLDLMRLMSRTGALSTERDYVEYLQAIDARRLPGEAQKVIEAGIAAGKLRTNDPFVAESRTVANGRVAADRASLVGLERDARASNASVATIIGAADAFLSYGDAAKAESLYTLALPKAGADSARVLTRLGIAQTDLGKHAEAQATFAKVDGARKPLAQLWAAYAAQKAGGV